MLVVPTSIYSQDYYDRLTAYERKVTSAWVAAQTHLQNIGASITYFMDIYYDNHDNYIKTRVGDRRIFAELTPAEQKILYPQLANLVILATNTTLY